MAAPTKKNASSPCVIPGGFTGVFMCFKLKTENILFQHIQEAKPEEDCWIKIQSLSVCVCVLESRYTETDSKSVRNLSPDRNIDVQYEVY